MFDSSGSKDNTLTVLLPKGDLEQAAGFSRSFALRAAPTIALTWLSSPLARSPNRTGFAPTHRRS